MLFQGLKVRLTPRRCFLGVGKVFALVWLGSAHSSLSMAATNLSLCNAWKDENSLSQPEVMSSFLVGVPSLPHR